MKSFNEYIEIYQKQLEKGDIKEAYTRLMTYMRELKTHFATQYLDYNISNNVYQGVMDISYFSITSNALKNKKLKVAIIFNHNEIRFEAWLAGYNKQIQAKYWKIFKDTSFAKYRLTDDIKQHISILEHVLIDNPDFNNLETLTKEIERETLEFISQIENELYS
ncbi:DUF7000 family protein [Aquimarina sp. 2201CG5-10]|uniref:DUF7000 family protein n=1 Tax=Aquimarina callyspongiae TaxID=3098150 RepID=UPI002AB5C219|nr:hypothetical protein [Aquimarina sp. 2201CG5-10]MDY8136176.1 hypothetical protein [Aquimarina sp. 2201CG5-10]